MNWARIFATLFAAALGVLATFFGISWYLDYSISKIPPPVPETNSPTQNNTRNGALEGTEVNISEGIEPVRLPAADNTYSSGDYALTVPDQPPGIKIFADHVRVPIPSWITIYSMDTDGTPRELMGQLFFPASREEQTGGGILVERLVHGETYIAAIQGDDGDFSFDREKDPFMKNTSGTYFMVRFRADLKAELP